MSSDKLKVLAVATMVIDHVGLFFFPEAEFMRVIGRLAFPIFGWLIANGAYHTRDIGKYTGRLFLLAILSQIPFALANGIGEHPFIYLNVAFTLTLGLLAIYAIKTYRNIPLSIVATALLSWLANAINTDYGAFGVLMIVLFYLFYEKKLLTLVSQTILFLIPSYLYHYKTSTGQDLTNFFFASPIEIVGLLSLIFILNYDDKDKPRMKYFFYYFYPLQYVLIYLFQLLLK